MCVCVPHLSSVPLGKLSPQAATMGDESEWMKLPIDQKCEHKVSLSFMLVLCECIYFFPSKIFVNVSTQLFYLIFDF